MSTYIFSRWKDAPAGCPVEFFSELDQDRYETRKVEIFSDGRMSYASDCMSTGDTELGSIPVPDHDEIMAEQEFDIREISAQEFEAKWREATAG